MRHNIITLTRSHSSPQLIFKYHMTNTISKKLEVKANLVERDIIMVLIIVSQKEILYLI